MLRRFLILVPLVLVGLIGLVVLGDWWMVLPVGGKAEYVGRDRCRECHQEQYDEWRESDHDRAMAVATEETVLADFDNTEFLHVAFEDLPKLSDADLATVAEHVTVDQWATAMSNIAEPVRKNLLGRLSDAEAVRAAMENFVQVRPCDSMVAQNEIGDAIRGLERDGKVTIDFAVRTRFTKKDGKFFATTDAADGKMKTFEVRYVFGVRPLQQYLVEFPGGRVQCLPTSWDTTNKRWFHLYPAEPIPAGDVLHWTGLHQNWNYMCAECHSTDLKKNFDLAENEYDTEWFEINVSCETCHGPGEHHVQLAEANSLFWDRKIGYGLPHLKNDDARVEIETCAPCHARRRVVYPGFTEGGKFLDYYIPELLDNNLYYADGQILEEDYVYGSFIQSTMYHKGVRCTDCHDPHTLRVYHTDPKDPWNKPPDNALCTDCHMETHPAGKYDTPAHHHHPDATKPGTKCVECHMPETTYMVADPRRDHAMRIPRPDLTIDLGIPNACNGCHNDRSKGETPEWAEAKLREWYGERKGERESGKHFAYAIADGRERKPEAIVALDKLTRNQDLSAAVRASAILLLGHYPSEKGHAAALRGLEDEEALIRLAAVQSFEEVTNPEAVLRRLGPMLHDPIRAVRTEAARLLSRVPRTDFNKEDLTAFDAAFEEYLEGQAATGDRPGSHMNMAVAHASQGDMKKAEEEYRNAIALDPKFVQAHKNLALLYNAQKRNDEAREELDACIRLLEEQLATLTNPEYVAEPRALLGQTHYELGLLLNEMGADSKEVAATLKKAIEYVPNNTRVRYNYALALRDMGELAAAERELMAAYSVAENPDFLVALLDLYQKQEKWSQAANCVEEMLRRQPGNPQLQRMLERFKQQATADKQQNGGSE